MKETRSKRTGALTRRINSSFASLDFYEARKLQNNAVFRTSSSIDCTGPLQNTPSRIRPLELASTSLPFPAAFSFALVSVEHSCASLRRALFARASARGPFSRTGPRPTAYVASPPRPRLRTKSSAWARKTTTISPVLALQKRRQNTSLSARAYT